MQAPAPEVPVSEEQIVASYNEFSRRLTLPQRTFGQDIEPGMREHLGNCITERKKANLPPISGVIMDGGGLFSLDLSTAIIDISMVIQAAQIISKFVGHETIVLITLYGFAS